MITDKQRAQRKAHIGGSDVAAILNVDPFKSAWQVWAEKTHKLTDAEATEAMEEGNELEPHILNKAERTLGKIIQSPDTVIYQKWPILAVNLDGKRVDGGNVVEAKAVGILNPSNEIDEYGEEGSDQIPKRVIAQVIAQCGACEIDVDAFVAAAIGRRGLLIYVVKFDKGLFDLIMEKLQHFWDYNVKQDMPPSDSVPSMDVVKRIIRIPKKTVDISDLKVEQWRVCREYRLDWEKKEEAAQAEMLAEIGTADAGRYKGGMITYFQEPRKILDAERLKEEKPEIAAEYVKIITPRVARIKKTNLLNA